MKLILIKSQLARLQNFWNSPYGPISTISLVLAVLGTFALNISFPVFGLMLIAAAPWLLTEIVEMELPGGFKLKLKDLEKYSREAKEAGLFQDSPAHNNYSYLKVYAEDPHLALAGLRIEIEKRLREIAEVAFPTQHLEHSKLQQLPLGRLREELREFDFLSDRESALLADLIPTLNQAVHGQRVSKDAADWVISDGSKILAALDTKIRTLRG